VAIYPIYTDIWRDVPSRLTQNPFQGPLQALAIWLLELHFVRAGSRKAHLNPNINILMFRIALCASGLTQHADLWRYMPIHCRYIAIYTTGISISTEAWRTWWYLPICRFMAIYTHILAIYGDRYWYIPRYGEIPLYGDGKIVLYGEIWWYMAMYTDISRYAEKMRYGDMWQCMRWYMAIHWDMAICAYVRWYVAIYDDIWQYLATYMAICRDMAIHGDMAMSMYGDVNRHRPIMAIYTDMPIYADIRLHTEC